jgi:hypothetical protein
MRKLTLDRELKDDGLLTVNDEALTKGRAGTDGSDVLIVPEAKSERSTGQRAANR